MVECWLVDVVDSQARPIHPSRARSLAMLLMFVVHHDVALCCVVDCPLTSTQGGVASSDAYLAKSMLS